MNKQMKVDSRQMQFTTLKFDYKLILNSHNDDICKKAGLKLNALSLIAPCMEFNKNPLLEECVLYVSIQLLSFD